LQSAGAAECNSRDVETYSPVVVVSANAEDAPLHDVLDRAQRGDGEAFGELYRRFSRRVFGLCFHVLGAREDAEDATGEVFLRARAALSRYDGSVPLGAWLTRVAVNHCVDRLRHRRREARVFASDPEEAVDARAPDASPLAEIMAEEERAALATAVATLPDRFRVPLVLRYNAEMSYDDIAERLGQTRQEVATSLFRAKQRLRRALTRTGGAS
jgi:RNA polymerase sigma-70 factor, ECF subfamily